MIVRAKFLASSHEINVSYISSIRLIRAWMVPPQTNQTTEARKNSEIASNHRHVLEVVPLGDSGDGTALLEDDNNRVRFSAGRRRCSSQTLIHCLDIWKRIKTALMGLVGTINQMWELEVSHRLKIFLSVMKDH